MYNYPFIRLIRAYISSLFSEKVTIEDKTTISMRCSIGDIDPYWEMNNGRYQQLADIGRFNHGFRTCLLYTSPSPRDSTLSRMPSSA